MVAPIIGPTKIVRSYNIDAQGSYYDERIRWSQAKPYTESLPYRRRKYHTSLAIIEPSKYSGGMAGAGNYDGMSFGPGVGPSKLTLIQVKNSAVENFRSKLSANSELLVTYAQRQQAFDMIFDRSTQLLFLARLIVKKDIRGLRKFARQHGARPVKDRKQIKDLASAWLEFSYGWVPLVGDIGSAVDLLQNPFPPARLNAMGSRVTEVFDWADPNNSAYEQRWLHRRMVTRAYVGARLSIENPNLWLANRLGFTNPLTIAWELVPFSFVVDWFAPVQSFLSNYSAYDGLKLECPYTTIVTRGTSTRHDEVFPPYQRKVRHIVREGVDMQRTTGLPSVIPVPRPLKRLSSWRSFNAISLLVGFLKTRSP